MHPEPPLTGVRIVDLTAMLTGPFATMLLADLGADVVKIEPPHGDVTRTLGPLRPDDPPEALGGYFQSVNRGKQSIVLDLKTEADKATFLELVAKADVVVENFKPGVMERLGLGYEELIKVNPRLVYGACRGFGDRRTGVSPYQDWPAFDVIAQAMSGFMSITGPVGVPSKAGPGIGDIAPGMLLALGLVTALRHAERTGEGQFLDVSMLDAMIAVCERIIYQYSYTGTSPTQQGNSHPLMYPFDVFPTKDGWVALAAVTEANWRELATIIGHPELITDPRASIGAARSRNRDMLAPYIEPWVAERTTAEVVEILGGRVPVGPVNNAEAVVNDPHCKARDMLVEIEQPGTSTPVTVAGVPIKFTKTPGQVRGRAPQLGEHTAADVLKRWT